MKKLLDQFFKGNKGALLVLMLMIIPMLWLLWSITIDGTDATHAAVRTKMALNRAVKGAVLALDEEQLAHGFLQFNEYQARENFNYLMQLNLNLNTDFTPRAESPLFEAPEILDFFIYQGPVFPYTHYSVKDIAHVFRDPGIMAVVRVKYKYNFAGKEQEIFACSAAEAKR